MKSLQNSQARNSAPTGCAAARRHGVSPGDVLGRLFAGLLAWALPCVAQQLPTQDVYFHRGAQHFLAGSNQLAKAEVERGLQLHPDDAHLKKFWELLNQQQQDQQNSDDQKNEDKKDQNDQSKSKQDQKDQQKKDEKDSSKQDQQKQDQQKGQKPDDKEQQQQQQAGKKDQDKKEGEEAKAGQSKPEEGQEGDPEGQAQPAKMIRMTPQQAVQLMETLKGDEKTFQFKPILRTNRTEQLRKNW